MSRLWTRGSIRVAVVGTGLSIASASSLKRSQAITVIAVPFPSLLVFLLIAALLGLGAASGPARRAAKLDVLAAIANDWAFVCGPRLAS